MYECTRSVVVDDMLNESQEKTTAQDTINSVHSVIDEMLKARQGKPTAQGTINSVIDEQEQITDSVEKGIFLTLVSYS